MFLIRRVHRIFGAALLLCVIPAAASAEPVITKTYSYFRIGGRTADDLDRELDRRGPLTHTTGHRHPGATEIKFGGDVTYVEKGGRCAIGSTHVTLRTHVILPRWTNRYRAPADLGFIWDTLSMDIKRHEERHAEIARTHARLLERTLLELRPERSCELLEKRVAETTKALLEGHDLQQARFDQVEAANFDARMMRLLQYRLQQKTKN
jgi:predicted secreted Zn-dependent protease